MEKERLHNFKVTFYAKGAKHETVICSQPNAAAAKLQLLSMFSTYDGSPIAMVTAKKRS